MSEAWRYEIQYGPDGEDYYAWVYDGKEMIGTFKTHRAKEVVEAVNSVASLQSQIAELTAENERLRESAQRLQKMVVGYLDALDSEPENDCDDGGGAMFPSDWAHQAHDKKVWAARSELRAALTGGDGNG